MQERETYLLLDRELNPLAIKLYIAMRHDANCKNATLTMQISEMIQVLTFTPPLRSKDKKVVPTKKQIRLFIDALVKCDLVRISRKGNIKSQQSAVYFLPQFFAEIRRQGHGEGHVTSQQIQGIEPQQGHAQGHVNTESLKNDNLTGARKNPVNTGVSASTGYRQGHGEGHGEGHVTSQQIQGIEPQQGHGEGHGEGHVLDIYNNKDLINKYLKEKNNKKENENSNSEIHFFDDDIQIDDLEFDTQMQSIAKQVGLRLPTEQLQDIFLLFTNHEKYHFQAKPKDAWIKLWRSWCVRNKKFHKPTNHNSNTGVNQHEGQIQSTNTDARNTFQYDQGNATASVLNWCLNRPRTTTDDDLDWYGTESGTLNG